MCVFTLFLWIPCIMGGLVLIVLILLAFCLVAFYVFMTRNFNYWKKRNVPYIKPVPIFGNMTPVFTFQKSIGNHIADLHHLNFEPYTGFYSMDQPAILIRDLDMIKNILVKDFNHFINRNFTPDVQNKKNAFEGLFMMKGKNWRKMRTKLTPAFTSGKIKQMFTLVHTCATQLDSVLAHFADSQEDFDVKDVMSRFTTDVISTCAFGLDSNTLENPESDLRQIGKEILQPGNFQRLKEGLSLFAPWILRLFHLQVESEHVRDSIRNIIWSAVAYREKNNVSRNDLLDNLLQIRKETRAENAIDPSAFVFDGDSLIAQCLGFFLAGYETSSTAQSLTLYELALNSDIQEKLRDNITKTLSKHDNQMTYESVQDMAYLQQVINETLRKYPTLSFLDRECVEDYQVPETKLTIEAGVKVFISLRSIQNDPAIFPNPDNFDPDRFTAEKISERHKFSFLPFGEGPRNCIGMRFGLLQAKVGLIQLLQKYRVEPCAKTPIPVNFNPKSFITTVDGGLPLSLKRL